MLKNFLSFKNETTLDMTAISAYKEHEYNLLEYGAKEKLLKVAAIYGANASGKSNLYLGMSYFQRIIIESLNNVSGEELTAISKYYVPFSFDQDEENTEFQIIEILGDYEYKYGFEYNDKKIASEWMYRKSIKTNRTTTILERSDDNVEFGASVRKECDAYKEQIPSETLVLSFFNKLKLKTDIFNIAYQGFMSNLVVDTDFYEDMSVIEKVLPKIIDSEKNNLTRFLTAIDTGIKDIAYETKDREINFYTTHTDWEGNKYTINLFNESQGTIKSIVIYIYASIAIINNKWMFVDELNTKLHPLLLKFIIDLFYNEKSSAQLIYATHDTTLLDKKFFRRDQIWFVQKDEGGHSELTALSDFKVRADASFEKDYLAGVYGGIPLIKDFDLKEGE
jgi:AAA15 family ATPase/GTPase